MYVRMFFFGVIFRFGGVVSYCKLIRIRHFGFQNVTRHRGFERCMKRCPTIRMHFGVFLHAKIIKFDIIVRSLSHIQMSKNATSTRIAQIGLRKGGAVLCGKIQHLRASIAGTSLGKSLFDVFCVFVIFARLDISSFCRLHCVCQKCISGGVFFDALILAGFGRCKNVEIWRLSFFQSENATSSQFRASEAHFRVSSCVVIYSTCGPFWP